MKKMLSILSITLIMFSCSCNQKINEPKNTTKDVDTALRQFDTLAILLKTSDVTKHDTANQAYTLNANMLGAFLAPSALERDGDDACAPKKHNSIVTPIIGDGDYMLTNWTMCMYEQRANQSLFDQLLDYPPTCLAMGIAIALIIFGIGLLMRKALDLLRPILFPYIEAGNK